MKSSLLVSHHPGQGKPRTGRPYKSARGESFEAFNELTEQHDSDVLKCRKRARLNGKWVNNNVITTFKLWRGNTVWPRSKEMTMKEASEENRRLLNNFYNKLDTDKETVLWRWQFTNEHHEHRKAFIHHFWGARTTQEERRKWWEARGYTVLPPEEER